MIWSKANLRKNVKDILIPSEEYRIEMYPMDFEEYLWASKDTITMSAIQNVFTKRKPLGDVVHRNILSLYEEDLAKYDDENREKASVIYRTIPEQLQSTSIVEQRYIK